MKTEKRLLHLVRGRSLIVSERSNTLGHAVAMSQEMRRGCKVGIHMFEKVRHANRRFPRS